MRKDRILALFIGLIFLSGIIILSDPILASDIVEKESIQFIRDHDKPHIIRIKTSSRIKRIVIRDEAGHVLVNLHPTTVLNIREIAQTNQIRAPVLTIIVDCEMITGIIKIAVHKPIKQKDPPKSEGLTF